MQADAFELKEQISQMPDEELLKMVGVDARQYRWEALELAKTEIARRGLAFNPQANIIRCSKCPGAMEEGFIPDYGHYGSVRPVTWVEGKPESSFWTGTAILDRRTAKISVYRCTACGHLSFTPSKSSRRDKGLSRAA